MSLLVATSLVLATSCATILTGSKQKVTFKSNASGKVFQNLTEIGKTNEVIKIKRKDIPKLYTIKVEGFEDKKIELPIHGNAAFYVNILCGVFITGYFDLLWCGHIRTDKVIDVNLDLKEKK